MKIQNEYLIIIDKKRSNAFFSFCRNKERLLEFIEKNTNLSINSEHINNNEDSYRYSVERYNIENCQKIFFYFIFYYDDMEENVNKYKNTLKKIKSALYTDKLIIETLRDDLSYYYSKEAYPMIHAIENLMRKLITYFMIKNIGLNWIDTSMPGYVKNVLQKSKRKEESIDILQKLDFIHLGDFLFKSYPDKDISSLSNDIRNDVIDKNTIKSYVPKSNWERYFDKKIDCDSSFLKKRWDELYQLRNKIAHNSFFTESDLNRTNKLTKEIKSKLESAFNNIDELKLDTDEKDVLSREIASGLAVAGPMGSATAAGALGLAGLAAIGRLNK